MIDKNDRLLLVEARRMNKTSGTRKNGHNKYITWLRRHRKIVGISTFVALLVSVIAIMSAFFYFGRRTNFNTENKFNIAEIYRDSSPGTFLVEGALLKNILIGRTAGSQGNKKVRKFIEKLLRSYGWDVKTDTFSDETEIGKVEFSNIIGSLKGTDKQDDSCVVIAAHYDSKLFRGKTFLGATDSAAPVAILLDVSRYLAATLPRITDHHAVKVVFFDGEEAFGNWKYDSALYGSRHLKEVWKESGFIKKIKFLLLLDILGHSGTSVLNIPRNDATLYKRVLDAQEELKQLRLFNTPARRLEKKMDDLYIKYQTYPAQIDDDDLPFYKENVRTLNLITLPFPSFHHTLGDSPDKLDPNVIHDISTIVKKFIITSLLKDHTTS